MPAAQDPGAFTDEELLALLRDATVDARAIVEEMRDAGATPHAEEELRLARELLDGFAPEKATELSRLGAELREVLLTAAVDAGAGPFVAVLAASDDKGIAKLGKKGIHILRTRGVTVEPQKRTAAPPPSPAPAAEEFPALMTLVSGAGERTLYIPFCVRGGIDVAYVKLSDVEGILSARIEAFSRKEFRRVLEALPTLGYPHYEVPTDYARGLVLSSLDLNASARRAVPPGFNDVAFLIGRNAPRLPSPGKAIEIGDEEALVRRGAELFEHSLLKSWGLPQRAYDELLARRDDILASPLYIDDAQRDASLRDLIDRTTREWFQPGIRAIVAERLYDVAYYFQTRNERDGSELAVASARALESDRDVALIPFAVAFVGRELGPRPIATRTTVDPDASLVLPR